VNIDRPYSSGICTCEAISVVEFVADVSQPSVILPTVKNNI